MERRTHDYQRHGTTSLYAGLNVGSGQVVTQISARQRAREFRAFLERIEEGVHRDPGIDAEQVARGVLALLAERLPEAELEDAKAVTPEELRAFWPA